MSIRTIRRVAIGALIGTLLSACSDNQSPAGDHFTGRFTLTHADQQPLPAPVFDGTINVDPQPSFHLRIVAASGTITVDANGHYEQRLEHDTYIDGVWNGRVAHVDRGECTRAAAQLVCESSYLESVAFTATIAGATLTIAQDIADEGHVATYTYAFSGS